MQLHQDGRQPSVRPHRFKFIGGLVEKPRSYYDRKLEAVNQKIAAHDAKRVQFAKQTDWAECKLYGKPLPFEKPSYSGMVREVVGAIWYLIALYSSAAAGVISLVSFPMINDSSISRTTAFLGIEFMSITLSAASIWSSVRNFGSDISYSMKRQIDEKGARLCHEKEKILRRLGCAETQEKT